MVRSFSVEPLLLPPAALEEVVELAFLDVLRALEHQVLEEMREAGAPGFSLRRSDVIPDVHRDDRHAGSSCRMTCSPFGERELRVRQFAAVRPVARRALPAAGERGRRREGDATCRAAGEGGPRAS
ncbi:MAG: hypothetical protein QM736_23785 [Vicinamibacterales bacterium]